MRASIGLLFCCLASSIAPAIAQTQRSGSDTARVAQQLQQSAAEKIELQSQLTLLKTQNDDLKKKLDKANADQQSTAKRLRDLEAVNRSHDSQANVHDVAEIEKTRAQMQELIARFRETATNLRTVEQERNELRGVSKGNEVKLQACAGKNVELATLGNEILDRYEHKGIWTSAAQSEPFTKIARTRLENMVDEYRSRIDDLKVPSSAQKSPADRGS